MAQPRNPKNDGVENEWSGADDVSPAANPGVEMNAGENLNVTNSTVAGGDIYQDQRKRNIRIGIGGLAAIVLIGGGVGGYQIYRASSTGVVSQAGIQGAAHTAAKIKSAEISQNADQWCFLASSKDSSTCKSLMSNSFSLPSNCRNLVSQVSLGTVSGNDNTAQVPINFRDRQIGMIPLTWTGQRWQLNSVVYLLAINNGGLLMSAVESATGGSALLGVASCR